MPSFLGWQGRDSFDDKPPFPGAKARMTHCVGAVFWKPWRHVSLTCSVFFVLSRCRTVLKLHFSRAVPQSYLGCWLPGYSPQCGSSKTLFFFLMWTIFKVCIEFVTILLLFYVFIFWPQDTWDLSSPTRYQTCTPSIRRQSLNYGNLRKAPILILLHTGETTCHWERCCLCEVKTMFAFSMTIA